MATIQTRKTDAGENRFRALVRRKGFPPVSKTFARKTEAMRWALGIEADMEAGRYRTAAGGAHTVADMIHKYVRQRLPAKKTGHRQRQQLELWRRLIGDYELNQLQPQHIAAVRDSLAETRSPGTVVRYLAALSHAFTIAIRDWHWIQENPCRLIEWPREPRGRVRFLSDDERVRLLEACRVSRCQPLYAVVMLALLTGMRRGEILGLRWRDVDLERRRLILTETKNNERRQVPLTPKAVEIVTALPTLDRRPSALLFRSPRGGGRAVDIRHPWEAAVQRAGLEDFRFHDLRHTAASYLAMSGATTNEIAAILGHKTLSMVQRYAHLTTEHAGSALVRMESAVFSVGQELDATPGGG